MQACAFDTRRNVEYLRRGQASLCGDLHIPEGAGPFPAIVCVHGGGWRLGATDAYQYFAPWLAARGYVVFTPTYTLAAKGAPSYPAAVEDILTAIQFLRGRAAEFRVDAARVAITGESAGGYLAAMAALAGAEPQFARQGAYKDLPVSVKAAIPVYGIFDMPAQWRWDQLARGGDHITEPFLGVSLLTDRKLYNEASPLTYVVTRANQPAFFIAWGAVDDVVEAETQSIPFFEALKMAKIFARTCRLADAPHYWMTEPLDDQQSFSGFFSTRMLRFLQAKL